LSPSVVNKKKPLKAVAKQIISEDRDDLQIIYVSGEVRIAEKIRGAIEVPVLQGGSMTL